MKGKTRKQNRRHTNKHGRRQIKRGKTKRFIKDLARQLGVPYGRQEELDD